jgi:hypothetical protein
MAVRSKKGSPYEVGKDVWLKGKITRAQPHATMKDTTVVTVQVEGGHLETLWIREGDDRVQPRDAQPK